MTLDCRTECITIRFSSRCPSIVLDFSYHVGLELGSGRSSCGHGLRNSATRTWRVDRGHWLSRWEIEGFLVKGARTAFFQLRVLCLDIQRMDTFKLCRVNDNLTATFNAGPGFLILVKVRGADLDALVAPVCYMVH